MDSIELIILPVGKILLKKAISGWRKGILLTPIYLRSRDNLSEGSLRLKISNTLGHKAKINCIALDTVNNKIVRNMETPQPFELEDKDFKEQIIKFEFFERGELQENNDFKIIVVVEDFKKYYRIDGNFSVPLD